ncbi:hypothetical protein [Rhodococcus sp. SGAir0479]|uniref:hypothetical protein n=1 Tax=Rhodococcus sp. SGAir0479 TaxID=2567884 RepID=UPI0010CD4165|nr:hypothetical protein [Rhodococcus sp. SGAir0479]QCQ91155.1 hypothetical protein E7742_07815 [Rhodococcus sp. SGAir0479]
MRHAWIRRPGDLRVEDADGNLLEAATSRRPYAGTMYTSDGRGGEILGHWPTDIRPAFAEDGLVEAVPDRIDVDYDQPFYEDYRWVAMLNPIELADRVHNRDDPNVTPVDLHDVTRVEHHGRPALQATAQPTPAYDPRCPCCPLLIGEFDHETDLWAPGPPSLVRVDEQTGICVSIEHPSWIEFDVEIIAVDQPLSDDLFTPPRQKWFRR